MSPPDPGMAQHRHAPRECRIVKSDEYEGYGFNLYQEKSKPGQYIGRIEPGSPADKAGLLENDRLVEVNGVNIGGENHKQVVARIKSRALETVLLVADSHCDSYHRERGVVITSSLPYTVRSNMSLSEDDITAAPCHDGDQEEEIDTRLQKVSFTDTANKYVKVLPEVDPPAVRDTRDTRDSRDEAREGAKLGRQDSGVSEVDAVDGDIAELGLDLSVEEARERIRRRRRHDPRTIPMKRASGDWWSQYKMIQTL